MGLEIASRDQINKGAVGEEGSEIFSCCNSI